MRILKRIMTGVFLIVGIILASYFLQPLKKGKGYDPSIQYEQVQHWLSLPQNIVLGNPTGLDTDTSGNIVVFHRAGRTWPLLGAMPKEKISANTILVIDASSGKLLHSWGSNVFIMPHGLTVDAQNNIWVTDVGLHQVFKFSNNGVLLLKLGVERRPGSDHTHFDKPTDVAVAADGSFYVSDGYGNSRVMRFSASGEYLSEWGSKGSKPGYFNIPHGIDLDDQGNVYVADRENSRVQVFDSGGSFLRSINSDDIGNLHSVVTTKKKVYAVDDVSFLKLKHRGSDVLVFDTSGKVQLRFGRSGDYKDRVGWFHDICIDAHENIYVGDILNNTILKFRKIHKDK